MEPRERDGVIVAAAESTTALTAAKELLRAYLADFSADEKGTLSVGSKSVLAAFPASFGSPEAIVLLARVGREAAGLGCLRPHGGPVPNAVELKHLYVRPHLRGRGIGRTLMQHLIHHAAALGARHALLDVDASALAAVLLYRQLGFAPCEPFNDGWPTGIHLALALPHPAPYQDPDVARPADRSNPTAHDQFDSQAPPRRPGPATMRETAPQRTMCPSRSLEDQTQIGEP